MYINNLVTEQIQELTGYHIENFHYKPDETPLSSIREVAFFLIGYLLVIYLLHKVMNTRPALSLKLLFSVHNLLLTLVSLLLLVLLAENLAPKVMEKGIFWGICSSEVFLDHRLEFYYYVNYLVKYWELLDTVFLVLKRKPLSFLHVYHHSMTALLCFTQLNGNTTVVSFSFLFSSPLLSSLLLSSST